jgi:putative transposase
MFLSLQVRLYPSPTEEAALLRYLRELRILWNYALADRQQAWTKEHRSVSYLSQQARLKDWRAYDIDGLGKVPYDLARDCLQRLDFGYRAAFRRLREGQRPGFPRFRGELRSFTFVPGPTPWTSPEKASARLKIPGIGPVRARVHRDPPLGVAKMVTVVHEAGSRWLATVQYEVPDPPPPPETEPVSPVGIDLGIHPLATLSTGEVVDPPKVLQATERKLAREQRRLARKQRGSHRYARQRERVAKLHGRVRRQRRDYLHKTTTRWVAEHDLIAVEDVDAARLIEGNPRAKGLTQAGWGALRSMIEYKERRRSGRYVEVPTAGTTQECSACGRMANPPLRLSDRVYRCRCGHEEDRDLNSSRTILSRGLAEVRRNTSERMRVDGGPPPTRKGRRAYRGKRECLTGRPGTAQGTAEVGRSATWPST